MYLELLIKQKVIVTTFADGSKLEWQANCWSRARSKNNIIQFDDPDAGEVSPSLFHTTNSFLALLPIETITRIEEIYRAAYIALEGIDIIALDNELILLIDELFSFINWDNLLEWTRTTASVNLAIGVKEALSEKDSADRTYFTVDYERLIAFSIMLKLIMPIWGMYDRVTAHVLNADFVLMHGLNLIRNEYINENPAFKKLEACVNLYARKEIKKSGYSITSDIGSEELPEYLLAMVLWKKIIVFDPRAYDKSIICDVHNLLEDKCKRIGQGGPIQKKSYTDQGEEMSVTEMYKIYTLVPPGFNVLTETYIEDYATRFNTRLTKEDIYRLTLKLDPNLRIFNFHIQIIAAITKNFIGIRTIGLLRLEHLQVLLITSYETLIDWGLTTLAEMLIAVPVVKDVGILTFSGTTNITALDKSKSKALDEIYSLIGVNPNPGITLIETIMKEVNSHFWYIGERRIAVSAIPNEIAELLIKTNK